MTDLTRFPAPDPKPEVRYEDAAAKVGDVEGWVCKTCHRFWGGDEHMARYCCATSLPCENNCGGRVARHSWTVCDDCRAKKSAAKWATMMETAVDWDGQTPLCLFDDDRYFFNVEDVEDYLDDTEGVSPAGLQLVLCEPDNGRHFDMGEYLYDHLAPDADLDDCEDINRLVNDWITAHAPFCWRATNQAVRAESVTSALGAENEGGQS